MEYLWRWPASGDRMIGQTAHLIKGGSKELEWLLGWGETMAHGLLEEKRQAFPLGFTQGVADVLCQVFMQLHLRPANGPAGLLPDGGELGHTLVHAAVEI